MDEEFNYDYNAIASPLYDNAITSPLYEPKSPLSEHYEPMQFKYEPDANGTTPVAKQIKIYGEEYRVTSVLQAPTQANALKIDQPKFEILSITNTKKYQQQNVINESPELTSTPAAISLDDIYNSATANIKQPQPVPTKTLRNYINYSINYSEIPELCSKCYGIKCFCALTRNLTI